MPRRRSKHITQYFEMFGHRSIYHDGWRAVCPWPGHVVHRIGRGPWRADLVRQADRAGRERLGAVQRERGSARRPRIWRRQERARLIAMIGMWYAEAGKYNVLPIDSRGRCAWPRSGRRSRSRASSTSIIRGRRSCRAAPAPRVLNSPTRHRGSDRSGKGARWCAFAMGGNDGGFSFYVQKGKLTYGYNYVADKHFKIESTRAPAEGTPPDQLRVRAHRQGRCPERQGYACHDQAVCRRQGGRPRRSAGDDPHPTRPRRSCDDRRGPWLSNHAGLCTTVRVHRFDQASDRGCNG